MPRHKSGLHSVGRLLSVVFLLLAACCPLPAAFAQSATATLSGAVLDEKGAVITGVTVTIINNATSLKRQTTTGAEGSFTAPLLPPGAYTVTFERDGFASVKIPEVVLNVGDQRAIQIQLKVGRVDETVTVQADSSIQESAAVATVVDRQFVENLPLNGRSFQSLINLTPGVVTTPTSFAQQGQFSVNGQRPDTNYFTVDGVSANAGVAA
ncbi:MAG: carboxypeptidase regulatory-like domain-containing protein, partial [Blastocatellia bacterium]